MDTIRPDDRNYPDRLRRVEDAPSLLYVLGTVGAHNHSIAIVGSRAASRERCETAYLMASELAVGGALVISGGALGIDSAAHRGALSVAGKTIAVLGTGLDVVYPARNRELFGDIPRRGGALVTIYKEGARPLPHHFLRRNRVIAGMADIVVVVEAAARSGALHTARAARSYGRPVAAVPGSPGTEWLISSGAAVAECAGDVLAALAGKPKRPNVELPPFGSERKLVLLALEGCVGRSPDELSSQTGLPPQRVNRHLLGLELDGLAMSLANCSNYVRSPLAHELLELKR